MATETNRTGRRRGWLKTILIVLLIALVVMQFFQPDKNNQSMDMRNDISKVVPVPDSVHQILKRACYDCHSDYTTYPWYANIQPVGWWLKDHIDEGKRGLNFQQFAAIKPRPGGRLKTTEAIQDHKFEELIESQEDKWMPLESYTYIHKDARLTDAERAMLISWANQSRKLLNADSASNTP